MFFYGFLTNSWNFKKNFTKMKKTKKTNSLNHESILIFKKSIYFILFDFKQKSYNSYAVSVFGAAQSSLSSLLKLKSEN